MRDTIDSAVSQADEMIISENASTDATALEVIPETDHFFTTGGLAELSELVRAAVS